MIESRMKGGWGAKYCVHGGRGIQWVKEKLCLIYAISSSVTSFFNTFVA
jgi:hypothetical protein